MTDDEIIDAVKDKHGISIATGVYRQAHLDLVSMARADERDRIVAWLVRQGITEDQAQSEHGWWDTSTGVRYGANVLEAIEAGEHLK